MFRKELPRLYELRDQIQNPNSPNAYFQDFDNKLKNSHIIKGKYIDVEKELNKLDPVAWELLKNEASPYLIKNNKTKRGWEQLFNILNQAHAYNYLKRIGCTDVQFIPAGATPTPDLHGMMDSRKVLCEVKTINVSDEEVNALEQARTVGSGPARSVTDKLGNGFFNKLKSDVTKAKIQLESYDLNKEAKHMVYINVHFDFWGEYKDRYFVQIDQHFKNYPIDGIEIIFHNPKFPFYKPVSGKKITIFNEDP